MSNAIRNAEIQISARRALWDAKMEESASHHVIGCFLLRLRQRKCNFEAPEPSQIHFLRFPNIFQKIEIFIIFWSIFWFSNHPHSLKQSSKEASEMISLTCSSMDARAFLFSSTLSILRFQDLMQRYHENSKGPDQPEGPTKMQRWRRVLRTM